MISRHLVKYVLTAAFRDRLVMTLALMVVIIAAVSVFMGAASIAEQGSFTLVFGAGALRLLGVGGVVLFCCFYVRRSFEHKEVEFLLSRPLSRWAFLASHAAAFAVLSFIAAAAVSLAVFFIGRPDIGGLSVWGVSLAVEFSVMAVAALFFSMVLTSAAGSALSAFGFYALARMAGTLLGIVSLPPANWVMAVLGRVMDVISVIVPRLDMMGQTSWLVYGVEGSVGVKFLPDVGAYALWMTDHFGLTGFIILQGAVFSGLLLAAAFYDFTRKQF